MDGTKLVHAQPRSAVSLAAIDAYERMPQSIIVATLKRRDGSGRVVVGLEPVLAVISFNVSVPNAGFLGVAANCRGGLVNAGNKKDLRLPGVSASLPRELGIRLVTGRVLGLLPIRACKSN
jgi:hypothetical protein